MNKPLSARNLAPLPGLRHAFFTRAHGNGGFSGQESAGDVYTARTSMALYLDVPMKNILSCYQIHSADVVTVTKIWGGEDRPRADAMVTNCPNVAIGVLTADCVPVLFADARAGVIGAAHAGWRGAFSGVLENTLAAMEKLGADRRHIRAALGPCIWQASYEVDEAFRQSFLETDPLYARLFRPSLKDGHLMFDLPGFVVGTLHKQGVASVEPSPADTYADPARFYSHRYSTLRNEKRSGNLMSAIALVEG